MKRCKACRRPMSKKPSALLNGCVEEYRDGVCVGCWAELNPVVIRQCIVALDGHCF